MFSQQYSAALLLVINSVASMFGYTLGNEFTSALVSVILGIWIMVRRYKQGDIRPTGLRI